MYQQILDEAFKSKSLTEHHDFEWNMAHGMFHLALAQAHMSGAISNLLSSPDKEDHYAANSIYKCIKAMDKIYAPADKHIEYTKMSNELCKIVDVISLLLDRIDDIDKIEKYLSNDKNFTERKPFVSSQK